MLPSLTETLWANAGIARAMLKREIKSRFICLLRRSAHDELKIFSASSVAAVSDRRTISRSAHGGQRPPLQKILGRRHRRSVDFIYRSNRSSGCFRFCRRTRHLLLILLDQTAHGIGRLRAFRNPMIDPVQLQGAVVVGLLRIVGPDDLDEFSIARAAAVRHHHLVIRTVLRSFSA